MSENGQQSDEYNKCFNNTQAEDLPKTNHCPTACQSKNTAVVTKLTSESGQEVTSSWDIVERGCAEVNQVEEYHINTSSFYCEEENCAFDDKLLSDVLFCLPETTTTTPVTTTVGCKLQNQSFLSCFQYVFHPIEKN